MPCKMQSLNLLTRGIRHQSRFIFPSVRSFATVVPHSRPQNLIEKIVQRYAVDLAPGTKVAQGDFVSIRPEHVMTHDNTGAVMGK